MFRSVNSVLLTGFCTALFVALFTLASIRSYATYRNTMEVQVLKSRLDAYEALHAQEKLTIRDELNALEKTVYSPPATVPTFDRKPAAIEQWQINRFRDLETRISGVERRLYKLEQ